MTEVPNAVELPRLGRPAPRIHVVGAGGAGMSAIATVLSQMGYRVSGSDQVASEALAALADHGVLTRVGHSLDHVGDAALVTASTAVARTNPEIVGALRTGIPVWSRATILAALTRLQPSLAIAGTHGKTTTSAMLAMAMSAADLSPSFVIGAAVSPLGCAARWNADARWLIVEADESDGTFLELDRAGAVLTSVEPDHLAHYGSVRSLVAAFERFVDDTEGPVAVCVDDDGAREVVAGNDGGSVCTYGTAADAMFRIDGYVGARASCRFALTWADGQLEVELAVPGLHNARNAAGAFALAVAIGADPAATSVGLGQYAGVARRFEFRGSHDGVDFVDDYAHLPTEIDAAIEAATDGGWDRVVAVFQPHRYSRTAELHASFGAAFDAADHVVITDIYSSGEDAIEGVTGELVAAAVRRALPHRPVEYVATLDALTAHLGDLLRTGDLCLTLGAGDLTEVPTAVLAQLRGAVR